MARSVSTIAERSLVALLQLAYSGERAAALAYRGHGESLTRADERAELRAIEEQEWHHRELVGEMLAQLGAAPNGWRERRALAIGSFLALLCRVAGWLVPMYGAGRLESRNIREYERAARLARACGRSEWIDALLTMAEVEWDHERYFRERVRGHPLGKRLPLWSAPPGRERIRAAFDEAAAPESAGGAGVPGAPGARRAGPGLSMLLGLLLVASCQSRPRLVSLPTPDGGFVYADEYGRGPHAVVLAHGARLDHSSRDDLTVALARAGYRTLVVDLRGGGPASGGSWMNPEEGSPEDAYLDVLAGVRYLRRQGAARVAVVGAGLGGAAAAQAAVAARENEIDRVVLLAAAPIEGPERMKGKKLFLAAREDFGEDMQRLPDVLDQFERAPEPKQLVLLEGAAHAQPLFDGDQGPRLIAEILRFLEQP